MRRPRADAIPVRTSGADTYPAPFREVPTMAHEIDLTTGTAAVFVTGQPGVARAGPVHRARRHQRRRGRPGRA